MEFFPKLPISRGSVKVAVRVLHASGDWSQSAVTGVVTRLSAQSALDSGGKSASRAHGRTQVSQTHHMEGKLVKKIFDFKGFVFVEFGRFRRMRLCLIEGRIPFRHGELVLSSKILFILTNNSKTNRTNTNTVSSRIISSLGVIPVQL